MSGTLSVEVNTTALAVNESFLVGGVTTTLTLDTPHTVQVSGTGLTLAVLGQSLTGDLTMTRTTDAARTHRGAPGRQEPRPLARRGRRGHRHGDPDRRGRPHALARRPGRHLRVAVSLVAPGVTLGTGTSGSFSVDVDTRAASRTLRVQGSGVTLTVPGRPSPAT